MWRRGGSSCARLHRRDLFGAIFNKLASDFDVIRERCAGTQLFEPPFGNQIRKSPKPAGRNGDVVSCAGRRVFDEITLASGTVKLNERFAGLDFYAMPFRRALHNLERCDQRIGAQEARGGCGGKRASS